jgi:DNA modification methylase
MQITDPYIDFLTSKIKTTERHGLDIDVSLLHPSTKPHQRDIIEWSCGLGAALIAADAGLGKTHIGIEAMRMLHHYLGGRYLIVTELGASDTFVDNDPEVGEGARLGVPLEYVTNQVQALASANYISVTNYERVRNGEFDFSAFTGVWLDEGNYVKNMASETTDVLKAELAKVKYKFIATATPSPNETLELINYAHCLGICDRGQILTRFFQRNSVKAGELTLHPQHEDDFWLWVHSWCITVTKPSDLGYEDEGYALPKLNIHWVEISIGKAIETKNKDGQYQITADASSSLPEAAKVKQASIEPRLNKALEIMKEWPENDHWLIWHHLEPERKAITREFKNHPSYGVLYGTMPWPLREKNIVDFTKGDLQILATKPDISGVGVNFQKHCQKAIALGINHSWNDFYQAIIKRIYRFGVNGEVNIYAIYVPEEYEIVKNLKHKWRLHDEMRDKMRVIVKKYGLSHSKFIEEKKRSFITERKVWEGKNWIQVCDDNVFELRRMQENSIGLINTSFPFGNHYEYTDKYNDFGHNTTNQDFSLQLDYMIPEMLRVLQPGRICAVHLKNRIHYGSVTGLGFSTFHRFTHLVCDAMERNGFYTLGFHYIPTDVVAENNQTYRLGYSEMRKDATKMGSGIPEEIWIFRKAPTSNADAYADDPVTKRIEDYSLAHWQVDADSFWRSSGNRYLTPDELRAFNMKRVFAWWKQFNSEEIYNYDNHVQLLKDLDGAKKLSKLYTTLPLRSTTPFVWNDVNRMNCLNLQQSIRKLQKHICPQAIDEVDRIIELYSNAGDWVLDNFGGIGTTGVRALSKGRKAYSIDLNIKSATCAAMYLKEQENKKAIPTLFDSLQEA